MDGDPVHIPGEVAALRDWRLDDLAHLERWMQPGHAWQRMDGPYYARPGSEGVRKMLAMVRGRIETEDWDDPRQKLVIADLQTDHCVGSVNRYWLSEETRWLALGITIHDPAHWRRGIGFDALGLWTEYLFTVMPDLVRLDLRTWSGNHGMMRLAEKLGYVAEARFRKARVVDGEYFDGLGYGVLREEWRARHPHGFGNRDGATI